MRVGKLNCFREEVRCDNETEISFMREVVGASASGDRILEKGSIPLNLMSDPNGR